MAEMNTGGGGHEKGKPKKLSTRVDFTPMVDLMFLLITFFMLATSMIKPQTMEIVMPAKDDTQKEKDKTKFEAERAITIIPGKNNKLYYYLGTRSKEGVDPVIVTTDYSPKGLRALLIERNKLTLDRVKEYKASNKGKNIADTTFRRGLTKIKGLDKKAPLILIKATKESTYGNLVNILDEMNICNIATYAIVDIQSYDLDLLKKQNLNQ
jgi:biopolymer transport protein ExbD